MSNNDLGCSSRWVADCELWGVCDVVLVEQKLHLLITTSHTPQSSQSATHRELHPRSLLLISSS